eukprot:gene9602-biopygen15262
MRAAQHFSADLISTSPISCERGGTNWTAAPRTRQMRQQKICVCYAVVEALPSECVGALPTYHTEPQLAKTMGPSTHSLSTLSPCLPCGLFAKKKPTFTLFCDIVQFLQHTSPISCSACGAAANCKTPCPVLSVERGVQGHALPDVEFVPFTWESAVFLPYFSCSLHNDYFPFYSRGYAKVELCTMESTHFAKVG